MLSKYTRQTKRARRLIAKDGTLCTWIKSSTNSVTSDDTSPEFVTDDAPTRYPDIPIVFFPEKRQSLVTVVGMPVIGAYVEQLFAYIPGDVPFYPALDDAVEITRPDGTLVVKHVSYVNSTQPDFGPVLHEIGFK